MRDCVIGTSGHAGLVARCHMMEKFSVVLQSAPAWTKQHLVARLRADDHESVLLWRAIASGEIDANALRTLGDSTLQWTRDSRIGEVAQENLVEHVVYEVLNALHSERAAAVSCASALQMLRRGSDTTRIVAARTIKSFVEHAIGDTSDRQVPDAVFLRAVQPFLQKVWPKERSFATRGVSRELCSLPAMSGEAFAEAVVEVERFLTPFDCWSMLDYGLCDAEDTESILVPHVSTVIDSALKANTFLRLLDSTIGEARDATVPSDLSEVLNWMATKSPSITRDRAFRRLSAAARRG